MKILSTWLVLCGSMWLAESLLFDLDVKLDSSLAKGGTLSKNTGSYLYDSFRTDVVGPAFNSLLRELRSNRKKLCNHRRSLVFVDRCIGRDPLGGVDEGQEEDRCQGRCSSPSLMYRISVMS